MMSSVRAGLSGCDGFFRMLLKQRLMIATRASFASSRAAGRACAHMRRVPVRPIAAAAPARKSRRFIAPPKLSFSCFAFRVFVFSCFAFSCLYPEVFQIRDALLRQLHVLLDEVVLHAACFRGGEGLDPVDA